MAGKEKLRNAVRNVLRDRGLTQGEAAAAIQATDSSLRVWLSRNKFPKNIFVPLAKFCGLPSDQKALMDQYDFAVGSKYTTVPYGIVGTPGQAHQEGIEGVLAILEDARRHEDPEQLVVHLHSSIGFYTGTQPQLAREIAKFLKQETKVVFFASTWETKRVSHFFDPDRVRSDLCFSLEGEGEDWALSEDDKSLIYWGVDGSGTIPVPLPCLFARVGCISHLAETDCQETVGVQLTTPMLGRSELIDMWIEVTPYVSSPDLAGVLESQWFRIRSEHLEVCEKINKTWWKPLVDSGCELEPLFTHK